MKKITAKSFFSSLFVIFFLIFLSPTSKGFSQEESAKEIKSSQKKLEETPSKEPIKIDIVPLARDVEIGQRIENILTATGWFESPKVAVKDGVVFLTGRTKNNEFKEWATKLARNTQDVTAVVNKIKIIEPSIFESHLVIKELFLLQWHDFARSIPSFILGVIILIITLIIAFLVSTVFRLLFLRKCKQPVLKIVISRSIGIVIFLIGIYLIFEMAGLTNVALTVIGGTGLLGIILGIAFRDITENILASILLSIQNPFQNGDLIEIEEVLGYVQKMTMRVTVLMSLEGYHIQIPNATIYKSKIRNFTSNPNRREDFVIGIGFDNVISNAQEVALKVLEEHTAILKDPEPWVLVDSLGKSTINLRVYFWIEGSKHSWLKVRSSVIRLIKRAFQEKGISIPDEAREVIFPKGINLQESVKEKLPKIKTSIHKEEKHISKELSTTATNAESGLTSQDAEIKEQAEQSRTPEKGKDFLDKSKSVE